MKRQHAGWRDNSIEEHRNIRVAGFEVLKNLGELQLVVDYARYQKDRQLGNPTTGWGRVLLVRDLAQVMPKPAPQAAERVFQIWQAEWENVPDSEESVKRMTMKSAPRARPCSKCWRRWNKASLVVNVQ